MGSCYAVRGEDAWRIALTTLRGEALCVLDSSRRAVSAYGCQGLRAPRVPSQGQRASIACLGSPDRAASAGDNPGHINERGIMAILRLLAVTVGGQLFHTIRRSDGSWLAFKDVEQGAGHFGDVNRVTAV
jgi:hypothetical protein